MAHRRIVPWLFGVVGVLILAPALILALELVTESDPASSPNLPGVAPTLQADRMFWSAATPDVDAEGSFLLQAGTLAQLAPVLSFEVPYVTRAVDEIVRAPAISTPARGMVVYVADDGVASEIRSVDISDAANDRLIARLDEIVWDLVVDADNQVAYLAVIQRDGTDGGVLRLPLVGGDGPRQILDAAEIFSRTRGVILAAAMSLDLQLELSVDGRHLYRHACRLAQCVDEVIDLSTGAIQPIGNRILIGIANGTIYHHACGDQGCKAMAIKFGVGRERELTDLPRDAFVTTVDGRPVLVREAVLRRDGNALAIETFDISSGRVLEVLHAPPGGSLALVRNNRFIDVALSVDPGIVLVDVSEAGGTKRTAISIASGEQMEVLIPPIIAPGPPQGIAD